MPLGFDGIVHHAHDHVPEQLDRLLDDIEVAEMEWVEAAGVQDRDGMGELAFEAMCRLTLLVRVA